jgi:hypothetical protein
MLGWQEAETPLTLVPRQSLGSHISSTDAIAAAIDQLDDDGIEPELRADLIAALVDAIAGTRQKVDATNGVLAMLEARAAAAKAEIARLDKRAGKATRDYARLEAYVLATLEEKQIDRLEGETSTLARRLNPASVIVDDPAAIPVAFLRWPPQPPPPPEQPDKVAIKAALKAGLKVAGCRLAQTAKLVRS